MGDLRTGKLNEESPEGRAFEIRRRADNVFRSLFKEQWEQGEKTLDPKGHIVTYLKKALGDLIPEAREEVNATLDELKTRESVNNDQFLQLAGDIAINLMAKNLSLQEIETRLKERPKDDNNEQLSRALNCDLEGDKVILHVSLVFFSDSKEALESLIEGVQALAKKIKTEEKYKNVAEIVGHSSLVKEKHRLFSKYGFSVTKDSKGKPTDEIKISKEKLLELYGE